MAVETKIKPKVAFFDFTSCEGCQLNKLNLENHLLDVLAHIDIVEFREAMDDKAEEYDIDQLSEIDGINGRGLIKITLERTVA